MGFLSDMKALFKKPQIPAVEIAARYKHEGHSIEVERTMSMLFWGTRNTYRLIVDGMVFDSRSLVLFNQQTLLHGRVANSTVRVSIKWGLSGGKDWEIYIFYVDDKEVYNTKVVIEHLRF